ncbi:unnamed protein product [Adineta ricciae]|uniref:Peptidase S9 prolyl oligopeptidase catalytic domain-containing protein n=1 Tax=Adineta ricciae TaxID=249248 RepID=A0A814YX94_ADIRI|nr:unnamed protein product [Adineta ricciae]CAF1235218.1 unnamed protein product [Adineta ricciae]
MSATDTDYLIRDGTADPETKSKLKKFAILSVIFLLGVAIGSIPVYVYFTHRSHSNPPNPPTPSAWNSSDYQSNSDYYEKLVTMDYFNQTHNLRLDRLSSPCLHPSDGQSVIYLRKQYHMPDLNGSTTTLHWMDLQTNQTKQLTQPIWGIEDQQLFWIDAKTIVFLSNRAISGLTQIFQLNLPESLLNLRDYLEPIQITDYPLDIDNLLVNRQGTRLAFSCQVYSNLTIEETNYRMKNESKTGENVYKFDKLFIRHWDQFMLGRRHHPFIVSLQRNSKNIFEFSSKPQDVLFGIDSDSPTRPFGDAKAQWSFSASGNSFAYTRQHDETSTVAWSTNLDIYTVDLTAMNYISVCVTCDNIAADTDPRYSPVEEHVLVYRAQSVPGYESDQFKIKLINGSNPRMTILNDWDRSVNGLVWAKDGQSLFIEVGEEAENVIYKLSALTSTSTTPLRLLSTGSSRDISIHPLNLDMFVYTYDSITEPSNIYLFSSPISIRSLTTHNEKLLSKVRMSKVAEKFSFFGAKNETVWGWHIPPANGTNQKAPLAFLIHGGPQNSWYNAWSYRWNYQAFSSQGYAVIAINFHGSDSYGQNFTDSITGEYGTLPFEDLQLGLTAALKQFSYIDGNRSIALGASYGGYMINWIAGHPEMSQRFRALVNHDGLFDMRAMAYSTEELWFAEHDAGNVTQFQNPEAYEKFNPVNYVANWTQPMLVIHGGHDYRVPDAQGISTFTALQRRGIPSRLLYLPNENHWTVNPFNSIVWYHEVLHWMNQWTS